MKQLENRHTLFVQASGGLSRTGNQQVLFCDLQPEWEDDRPAPLDAPTFYPLGSVCKYDDRPLMSSGMVERRLV